MNRAWFRLVVASLTFATCCAHRSLACACVIALPGTCGDIEARGVSFVGTVIDIENPPDGPTEGGLSRYRFRVDENLSGVNEAEVDVYSGRGDGDCGYRFEAGTSYLVTPSTDPRNGKLMASICGHTQPASSAAALIGELRARRDGKTFPSIEGALQTRQQPHDSTFYAYYNRPLPGVPVELRSDSHTYSTQTDPSGLYRFDGIPPGRYHFTANLPPNFALEETSPSDPFPSITIASTELCYQKDLHALPTARIRGQLTDPYGSPLRNEDVELFRRERYKESRGDPWTVQSDDDGYFEFDHVTPGLYLIVFNNFNRIEQNLPYVRTFHPNARDFDTAVPVKVGKDEQFGGEQEILDADIHAIGSTNSGLSH
jgi:hypothetical protein